MRQTERLETVANDLVTPTPAQVAPRAARPRAYAVDALRGLGILGVVLGQTKPYGVLPAWLYHAQEPPPTHQMRLDLPGLTFSDLVFPFFLFTLGVAIPLALSSKLEKEGRGAVIGTAVKRGGLLFFLAWIRQHFDSVSLGNTLPEPLRWVSALMAFLILFLVFVRLPAHWPAWQRLGVRTVGWAAAAAMLLFVPFPDGSSFRPDRIDQILVSAAYCVVFGTLIWLATRRRPAVRVGVIGLLVVLGAIGYDVRWLNPILNFTPAPWLYRFAIFMLLCIAVPGTIVGDLLLRWMKESGGERSTWHPRRHYAIAGLAALQVPLLLAGIQARFVVETLGAAAVLGAAIAWLARGAVSQTERVIARLAYASSALVVTGVALDLVEGGTQKVPPTFAWYSQSVGLGIAVLIAFFVSIHVAKRQRWLQIFIDNGQNPMIAYVCYGMLLLPLLALSGIRSRMDSLGLDPWMRLAWGVAMLIAVGLVVQQCTRRRVFWRT